MRNNTFTFNGRSSDEFGIKIERFRPLNRPPRKFDAAAVSGRNGNIYKLQDAWEEILVSYEIFAEASVGDTEADIDKENGTYFTWTADGLTINGTIPAVIQEEVGKLIATRNRTILVQGGTAGTYALTCRVERDGVTLRMEVITTGSETFVLSAGDELYIDLSADGTFNNFVTPFKIIDAEILDLPKKWTSIMEWLNSADGYAELSDSFDPDHYRKAVFVDATDIQNSWNHYGRAVVSFHCRPERFLLGYKGYNLDMSQTVQIGIATSLVSLWDRPSYPAAELKVLSEGTQFKILDSDGGFYHIVLSDGKTFGYVDQGDDFTISSAYELFNPTNHIAKPTIWLSVDQYSGTYSLTINTITMTISPSLYGLPETLEIDCDNENFPIRRMNAQASFTDQNGNVSAKFLYLQAGFNWFVVGSGFTAVTLDANFWEI